MERRSDVLIFRYTDHRHKAIITMLFVGHKANRVCVHYPVQSAGAIAQLYKQATEARAIYYSAILRCYHATVARAVLMAEK